MSGLMLVLGGCARIDHLKYKTFITDIDGESVLEISTYGADFGRSVKHVPFLYRHMESHDRLWFQVFIRDKDNAGRNPHVESIIIHSFSYRFGDQPETVLLTDYADNFWMQGRSDDHSNGRGTQPILFDPHWAVTVSIEFTLNGIDYSFEGTMPGVRKTSRKPLLVHALR